MMFSKRSFVVVLVVVILGQSLLAMPGSASAQTAAAAPAFTEAPCQFSVPANLNQQEGKTYRCGTVIVPEVHQHPTNKTISLAVAVFKSSSAQGASDPVIYLEGGPGGFTLVQAADYLSSFQPLLSNHDLILFDQRGTGFSTPSLYCQEITDLSYALLGTIISPEESVKKQTDATLACRSRLVSQGVNLAAYTSAQNAADVDAIRQALGYTSINLYGISYGTRLALTVMRDFPKPIRSVVLDSVVPLEADLIADELPDTQRVFNQLWQSCAANARCNSAYPNLEQVFYQTVDQLNAMPVKVAAQSLTDGKTYTVAIDGSVFISFLFNSFYISNLIPALPAIIYEAHQGKLDRVASILILFTDESKTLSLGMYFSVSCPEEAAFTSPEKVRAAAQNLPKQLVASDLPGTISQFTICNAWGTSAAPAAENAPVQSAIPTLVMAGSFDPVTPPAYGKQVAQTLSRSHYVEIANSGHGASLSGECPFSLVIQFFSAPNQTPNDACVTRIQAPNFIRATR